MPPRMLHGRLHVIGSLRALAMTALIALLALGVSGSNSALASACFRSSQLHVLQSLGMLAANVLGVRGNLSLL